MKLCECGCGGRTNQATQTNTAIGHVKGRQVRFIAGHNFISKKPICKVVFLCECGCFQPTKLAKQNDRRSKTVKGIGYKFKQGHNRKHEYQSVPRSTRRSRRYRAEKRCSKCGSCELFLDRTKCFKCIDAQRSGQCRRNKRNAVPVRECRSRYTRFTTKEEQQCMREIKQSIQTIREFLKRKAHQTVSRSASAESEQTETSLSS